MWFFYSLFFAAWTSIAISILKKLTGKVAPIPLLATNNLFILPFMLLILLYLGGIPQVTSRFYSLIVLSSVLDVIAALAAISAIKMSPISLISPISSFNPVFTLIVASLLLGETPTPLKFLGVITVVVGSYLLNITDIKKGIFVPFQKLFKEKGVQLFLLANFLWGITPIFQKQAIFETQPQMPLYPSFFGALLITFYLIPLIFRKYNDYVPPIRQNIKWFLLLAPFNALAQLAAFTAFSLVYVGYATAIFKLSTLFTIFLGAIFFKEERIKERLLGAIVMIIGTILLVV